MKPELRNTAIVLKGPKNPENIGAAARAACNMGLGQLLVVGPENMDRDRILRMATHAAAHFVENMAVFDDLEAALAPFNYVVGTSARLGRQRRAVFTPREMARKLVPLTAENRVAILFGPEDRGLTNEALRLCHALVHIPTAEFTSLNLAQAVMILCYEVFLAARTPVAEVAPRLATRHEQEGMYSQLQEILLRLNFINPQNPEYWMTNMRRFFDRLPLRAKEVQIIRGICRQMDWYARKCYGDGEAGRTPDWD